MPIFARRTALFVLLLLFPLPGANAQQPGIPDGWSDGYAHANGIRIHYYHAVPAPGRPAMVMVHGVTDIGLSWTTLTEKLQDSYDIYMLDARAHGLSDPFTATDDGNTLVKDVVAFVQAMKLEKPILMGHSLGAATVMRVGAEYPALAKAVIMLEPGLGRGGPKSFDSALVQLGAEEIAAATARWPRYYAGLRANMLGIATSSAIRGTVLKGLARLSGLYPEARYPDLYVVVGSLAAGGTASSHGMLLAGELFSRGSDTPLDELELRSTLAKGQFEIRLQVPSGHADLGYRAITTSG